MRRWPAIAVSGAFVLALVAPASTNAGQRAPTSQSMLLAVPYITQPPQLCGGAALSMVLRYWGARDVFPSDFASLVDKVEGGIRSSVLVDATRSRGWMAVPSTAPSEQGLTAIERELVKGRPVIALIEEGVTRYHYVVVTGFTPTGVIVHDPARAPFRVIPRALFAAEWNAADRWFMVVVPSSVPTDTVPKTSATTFDDETAVSLSSTPCAALVREQVALARKNELAAAEEGLRAATEICPEDASAWRELGGLRFLERRYEESRAFTERAARLQPDDRSTNELLAGTRFLTGDLLGALDAWNRQGEPRVDLIDVQGLKRTNHTVLVDRLSLEPRQLLTSRAFTRATRRLSELPTLASTRLTYRPAADTTADVTVVANERNLVPRGAIAWSVVGATALLRRDVRLEVNSPFREGEAWEFAYRFAERRPRGLFRVALPSRGRLPGMTEVSALWEGQFYESLEPSVDPTEVRRRRLGVSVSDWTNNWLRWQVGSGWDRFDRTSRYVSLDTRFVLRPQTDRVSVTATASQWLPVQAALSGFRTAGLTGSVRSSTSSDVRRFVGTAGIQSASADAPLALWPVAGSSDTRGVLLRAHALYDDGVVNGERLGRRLAHATVEFEQPVFRHPLGFASVAVFMDTAKTWGRRTAGPSALDADVGIGARVDTRVIPGRLRLDLAHGMRDGRTAISAGIISAWGR